MDGAEPSGSGNSNAHTTFKPLCTPNPSPEAVALFKYIQDMFGKRILSGQEVLPWGINELNYVQENTGKLPAILGMDFANESEYFNQVQNAINWWKRGGIPTIMWHWGAPSKGEGYASCKKEIDINKCFEEGTPEYKAFWAELKLKADDLEIIRDAHVPVLWRPFHELNGGWFWWSKQGPELFIKLWRTVYNYLVNERKINNLVWVLCFSGKPDGAWNPGKEYFDIAGADTYGDGSSPHLDMYRKVHDIVDDDITPIVYHECDVPPNPDQCLRSGAMWSWWMEWHTTYLTSLDKDYLKELYDRDLVITLDDMPDIMVKYGD